MSDWFSIEVSHGAYSAVKWTEAYGDDLVTAAFLAGATDWQLHRHLWGVVIEVEFDDASSFDRYRLLPAVVAALDEVPDPVNGLFVHRGRGGSSGSSKPVRPRPMRGSGAAALPIPDDFRFWDEETDSLVAMIGGSSPSRSRRYA